jgi:hypothetical protein
MEYELAQHDDMISLAYIQGNSFTIYVIHYADHTPLGEHLLANLKPGADILLCPGTLPLGPHEHKPQQGEECQQDQDEANPTRR